MKPPTLNLNALLGASFGLAFCQFFPNLLALLNYAGRPGPPSDTIILTAVTCATAAFIMRYSYAKKPVQLPFIATAVFEAALTVYVLANYAKRLARLVQHGGSVKSIVEVLFYGVANVAVLAAFTTALAGVAAKLKAKAPQGGKDAKDTTCAKLQPAAKAPEPEDADYWLAAVAGISFAVMLRALAVFVEFAADFPPKPMWPLLYAAKLTLNIVQLTMSPVALYGGLKANRNCIIAGMAAAVLQVLLYAVLVVLNIFYHGSPAVLLPWSAVYGAQAMATVAVLATAYARISPPPPPSYNKVRPLVDGQA